MSVHLTSEDTMVGDIKNGTTLLEQRRVPRRVFRTVVEEMTRMMDRIIPYKSGEM